MFTMATRKRVILTLDSKVKVIWQHEKGTNRAHLLRYVVPQFFIFAVLCKSNQWVTALRPVADKI